ncbi:hypothetical protein DRN58_07715 [Thermococci archaeon]|nr:MAG: hypothetical protein DRN58_07715 [Thermococci archaeon]
MGEWLRKLGYMRSRGAGRTFINYQNFEISNTNAGKLREYDAINLDFMELKDNRVFVWIETYTSPMKSVLDFLNEKLKDKADKRDLLNVLNPLKLRIAPSGVEIQLKDILLNRDLTEKNVPGTRQTFKEYWKKKYGIELSQKIQPIFIIKGWDGDLQYPAEMVFIDRYSLEKYISKIRGRKPRYEDPAKRAEKIENLFYRLKKIGDNYLKEYITIDLQKYCPTAEELLEFGGLQDAIHISPPLLEFYRGAVSLDPLDVFNPSYGIACGKKNLFITHLILPYEITEQEINRFTDALQKMFSSYRFGKIERDKDIKIIKYNISADIQDIESRIRGLDKTKNDGNIGIAVLPDDGESYYYSLKKLFPSRTGNPLIDIKLSTLQQILSGSFPGSKYLSLKFLIKTLEEDEAIWTLANAAGLLKEKTLFIGISFSRYPRERRVSKCAAVLHDSHGNKISWKVFSTPQERTITKQWFDALLFRIRDIVEKENPTRLLFYRTGTMHSIELDAIKNSIKSCSWLAQIKISFVSILDGKTCRFYLYDEEYKNIPPGYGFIMNNREAFLSTSNYDERDLKQGTVIPVRLKLEIGDDNIIDILKEYHDLTYLNWLAPETTAKHPLVVRIAERFAELTREGIPTESMFYLDL